jgi:hypothetical protein
VMATNASTDFRLTVLDVTVEHTNTALFQRPQRVVVTVGVPPGRSITGLTPEIDDRLEATAGHDIETEVRYVTTETE